MFNRSRRNRRKEEIDVKDRLYAFDVTRTRRGSGIAHPNIGTRKINYEYDTFDEFTEGLNSKNTKNVMKAVDRLQADAELRAEAEESNLDILDRGSRYIRKNSKLKKFEDAQ